MRDEQLSPHFSLSELTRSQTGSRFGIPNDPPPEVKANLVRLCTHLLEPLREKLNAPVMISSGYRSPALNSKLGGSLNSQHVHGEAADIIVPGLSPFEVCTVARILPGFDQLILEFNSWTHISIGERMRRQVLTALRTLDGVKYVDGLA